MDNKKLSNNEKLSRMMPWVDIWILETETVSTFNQLENDIFREIKTDWNRVDRISMLDKLYDKHGEIVVEVLKKLVKRVNNRDWRSTADELGDNSLKSFMKTLWGNMVDSGFDFTIDEKHNTYQIECTKCPLADLAKEIKGEKWIFQLACMSDYYMVEGFNPDIVFKRTKTLVEGHECCNHFYTMLDK